MKFVLEVCGYIKEEIVEVDRKEVLSVLHDWVEDNLDYYVEYLEDDEEEWEVESEI